MRFQFIQLVAVAIILAVGLAGCGKKRRTEQVAEGVDGISQADTADIKDPNGAETLPTIDQADTSKPSNRNDDTAVTPSDAGSPAPKTADSTPPPAVQGTGQMTNYSVQKGDTLMKIAFNVYGDISQWKNIYEWNKDTLKNANQLASGMQLKYDKPATEPAIEKNGEPYMIKKGDTLGTIADDVYAKKSKWKKIYENNRSLIHDPNKIYAGFYLYYQITEEEKREAEAIKAKRGGAPLGSADKLPDSAANTKAKAGKDALKGGGLNALATPPASRVPAGASVTPKK